MIDNPFAVLERRLNRLEFLLEEIKEATSQSKILEYPDRLNKEQALTFLNEQGYHVSESTLYKLTSTKKIPFKNFGRRLIFSRKELLKWVESQTIDTNDTSEVDLALARSARRKSGRRLHV